MANWTGPNKTRWDRQWLHKMGLNSHLEGWQRLALDNFLWEVVSKRRGIWIKWSLGQGQMAKRGIQGTGVEVRKIRTGMRLEWIWRWTQIMDNFEQMTEGGDVTTFGQWRKVRLGKKIFMRCFPRLKDNPAGKSLTWFKAVGKGFIERVPGGAPIFQDGRTRAR